MRSPTEPTARPPRSRATTWTIAIMIGFTAFIAIGLYGGYARDHKLAANPPAVLTPPAPASGVPAPVETTTGEPIQRPK
jgi:hypothetical protein